MAWQSRRCVVEEHMDDQLSRILDDGFLDGVADLDVQRIRELRNECQEVETVLSYVRRLAQGRLDIVGVELERRRSGGDPGDLQDLIERLPEVLSDRTRSAGNGHLPQILAPGHVEGELVEELADMEVEAHLTDLPKVTDQWLTAAHDRLVDFEIKVSGLRRALFDRIDSLQAELSERYRSGEASIDALISGD